VARVTSGRCGRFRVAALTLVLALAAGSARANGCGSLDRDTAGKAVALVRAAGTVIGDDWFAPVPVARVAWAHAGFLYRVVVNDDLALDLRTTYLPGDDPATYTNLGWLLGCGREDMPRTISRTPFVTAGDPHAVVGALPSRDDDGGYQPAQPLIGIVELPALEAAWYDPTRPPPERPLTVFAEADTTSAVRAEIGKLEALPYREYDYEQAGAVVLERRPNWYRIALRQGDGWIRARDAGTFRGLEQLVRENLSYLAHAWEGRIYAAPAAPAEFRILAPAWRRKMGEEIAVEVREARRVGSELWFRIEIIWPPPCGAGQPGVLSDGWVPAFASSGAPAVWYWSRGC
jgi:hypothetical protein